MAQVSDLGLHHNWWRGPATRRNYDVSGLAITSIVGDRPVTATDETTVPTSSASRDANLRRTGHIPWGN
jgi:hypothetical protein